MSAAKFYNPPNLSLLSKKVFLPTFENSCSIYFLGPPFRRISTERNYFAVFQNWGIMEIMEKRGSKASTSRSTTGGDRWNLFSYYLLGDGWTRWSLERPRFIISNVPVFMRASKGSNQRRRKKEIKDHPSTRASALANPFLSACGDLKEMKNGKKGEEKTCHPLMGNVSFHTGMR